MTSEPYQPYRNRYLEQALPPEQRTERPTIGEAAIVRELLERKLAKSDPHCRCQVPDLDGPDELVCGRCLMPFKQMIPESKDETQKRPQAILQKEVIKLTDKKTSTRGGHHPRYTKDEFQVLRQAILTGRGEGKDDKVIAESLVKNDIFPGRTAKALSLQMCRMLPKYSKAAGNGRFAYVKVKPGKMRKVSAGSGAYGRLQRLLTRREELIAERATVEAEIKATIKTM